MRRRRVLMLILPAAAVAVAIILVSVLRGGTPKKTHVQSAAQVNALLKGIPQSKLVLGSPKAPVTLVEFADLQCPYCGEWERGALPTIVRKYVRPGKVKIEFRGLHFIGSDSEAALRAALAAGLQNRLWYVVENLYEQQGKENSGWVTDALLRQIGDSVPGLDTEKMMADRDAAAVTATIKENDQLASAVGVNSTPTFFAGRKGEKLEQVQVKSLDAAGIEPTLDRLLAG